MSKREKIDRSRWLSSFVISIVIVLEIHREIIVLSLAGCSKTKTQINSFYVFQAWWSSVETSHAPLGTFEFPGMLFPEVHIYMIDPFREFKNSLFPGLAGMLSCVEIDTEII